MSTIRTAHPSTVAAVKSAVVATLIETLLDMDSEMQNSLPEGSYGVRLIAPGGIGSLVSFKGGTTGTLIQFLSCDAMNRTLSGEKAFLLPLPTGRSFLKGLKAFSSCATAVSKAMAFVPEQADTQGIHKKARLLLTAALQGVCEVYNHDHWIKMKSASLPEGSIAVLVAGNDDLSGTITQKNKIMTYQRGSQTEKANAVLEFSDVSVCYGVLTGSLAAMGELGSGRVMLKGKISMIQGLFPLLDRFGEIMK
ncbi:hypothetical protein EXM22_03990 [Oceanispirochaeta crateris]|uniref:SCP2 domain-containing protein n=1 Tax=Oceanispirochaeta crateris TaxID=2518645 RepID=A0A5C1QJM2_9SPIO|nr:hypothetical protein [Oceanispirochaeta crateris]QEN07190.1 hypothetical protein EXM22_03990 [Oceanispirochaeta crateris]